MLGLDLIETIAVGAAMFCCLVRWRASQRALTVVRAAVDGAWCRAAAATQVQKRGAPLQHADAVADRRLLCRRSSERRCDASTNDDITRSGLVDARDLHQRQFGARRRRRRAGLRAIGKRIGRGERRSACNVGRGVFDVGRRHDGVVHCCPTGTFCRLFSAGMKMKTGSLKKTNRRGRFRSFQPNQ